MGTLFLGLGLPSLKDVMMLLLLRREFVVELPLECAWQHLARVEQWPSWAGHIKWVEVQPPGELGWESTGRLYLTSALEAFRVLQPFRGLTATFKVTEFKPAVNWKWVGGFLWLTVHYDHVFEQLSPRQTKLIWIIEAEGFGVSVIGRLFAKVYSKNLDRAIPLLVEEMNACNDRAAARSPVHGVSV